MRRGRDPSRSPSRQRRPSLWDNLRGALPRTGIPSDGDSLYRRTEDQLPPARWILLDFNDIGSTGGTVAE